MAGAATAVTAGGSGPEEEPLRTGLLLVQPPLTGQGQGEETKRHGLVLLLMLLLLPLPDRGQREEMLGRLSPHMRTRLLGSDVWA